ncbi:unnamed protein product [Zymoseptoria tritici ST99CH_1E4]|uniref:Major facilitator superfamily (MFS) profile domain-containing protein n=1 Tax=Zymoseptoria tritici ST99CH_1E4 TaxID=1276532 RepID=A0A2H1H7U1_ZYMTR|nr:unnamed protein product [Zymoseptoria tritici ST99CH_1E4]
MAFRNPFRRRQASNTAESTATSDTIKGTSTHGPNPSLANEDSEKANLSIVDRAIARENVSLASFAHLDIKKINRKIDIRIIPVITALYLCSFIDRGNIGNAKIEGLYTDLRLTDTQYNLCLTVFWLTYGAFEVPSNMVLKRLRPSIWLPTIMMGWGIVMTLMGLVQGFHGLLVARLFLGMAEAGLAPGILFYLTMWYPRYEMHSRYGLFFSASCIAGAFSGLLAYAISFMDGVGNVEGWRWIFILEGLLTVVVALAAYFLLLDYPATASFLTPEERAFVAYRLKYDNQDDVTDVHVPECDARDKEFVKDAFRDWQPYVAIIANWGLNFPLYGVTLSLPTIIKQLGYKTTTAQLMTIPVYATAAFLVICVSFTADRIHMRSPFMFAAYFLMLLGFALCISSGPPARTYAGVFLVLCGAYPATSCLSVLVANNLAGSYKRAVGIAMVLTMSNMGTSMACNFYRQRDARHFVLGHSINVGFVVAGLAACSFWIWRYSRINKQRAARRAAGEHLLLTPEELSRQGDKAVTFVHTL